jgi:ubiquinone/menaquinone biosynthesis C-methylase UbiE
MHSAPYSQFAKIYDKVMAHVNYKMWAEYIKSLFQYTDLTIERIVDLSCGTGKHIRFLQSGKVHVIGADCSKSMVTVAKSYRYLNDKIKFLVNDARKIAFKNQTTDVVLMLYDSINYLVEDEEIENLFEEVYRILKPGAIFIFDFVTEVGLEECFGEYYESDTWDGNAYERHSLYSKKEKRQYTKFNFLYNGQPFIEEHVQQIRTRSQWKGLIKKSKMHLCAEFSNFSHSLPSRKSERIHFVCQKELS